MAVKDLKSFHKANMAMNKTHYTYMARMTHGRVVNLAQKYAARVHFNMTQIEDQSLPKIDDKPQKVNIRYGIIELDDLARDLEHWETLLVSSFMHRPFEVLEIGDSKDLIMEKQAKNLKSALAYGALTTKVNSERELYETIV